VFNDFFPENPAVCEVMWKNKIEQGRQQITMWRVLLACWITKAALRICTTAILRHQRLSERSSILRLYVHCLACNFSQALQTNSKTLQWNLSIKEPQWTGFFVVVTERFHLVQVLEMWILGNPYPQNCKSFPLNMDFRYAQVPFKNKFNCISN
jgi:hypothetical protein